MPRTYSPMWFAPLAAGILAAAAQEIPVDGYAAAVNDRIITVSEVMAMVQPLERQLKEAYEGEELEEKMIEAYREARESLIERALVLEEFKKQKGDIPEAAVEDRVQEVIRERFQNDRAAFLEALEGERMTLEEWREQVKDQLVIALMRRREVVDKVRISPSEVKAQYEARREQFRLPEKVQLRMIVIHAGASEEDKAAKRRQAEQIVEKLENGADFAALAKEFSEGSKASQGGDWGWVDPGILRPELQAVARSLEPGRHSGLVETGGEFYVLRVEGRQEATVRPFEEVEQDLGDELRKKETERLYSAWVGRLKGRHFVKVF